MAPHSSTLAWKIPWTEEPGRLQSMGLLRVRHDWETSLSLSCTGGGNGNSLQCSCLENPRDGGAWWAAICGVAQSQTRLKRLSSSSKITTYLERFNFMPAFSLCSFPLVKKLFSYSTLFAIRAVSSAYMRLLIFLLAILIPACDSSSPTFHLMYSTYGFPKWWCCSCC